MRRLEAEEMLAQRLVRVQKEGDLPPDARPNDLARYVCTVGQGLAVQAAGGALTTIRYILVSGLCRPVVVRCQ